MKIISLIIVLVVIMQGFCYSQGNGPVTIKLSKSEFKQSASNMSDVIDEISYIKLETSKEVIIGGANNYHLKRIQNCFCIYHSRCGEAIMLFEEDGKFRCNVGSIGQGPGEYSGIYSVFFDEYSNNIIVLQGRQVKLFDLQGNHISTIEISSNNTQIRGMAIVDAAHWMFSFFNPDEDDEIQAGVLMTDKNGGVIEKFSDFDSSIPGSNGKHVLRNRIYNSGKEIYFCPFDYNRTYYFNGVTWDLAYIIEDPFKKPPRSLYNSRRSELMKFKIDNGFLMSVGVYKNWVIIEGATPKSFNIAIDKKDGSRYYCSYFLDFHLEGMANDVDGGIPFNVKSISEDGYSYNMIDSQKLIDCHKNKLLNPDIVSHGEYMSLKEVLDDMEMDDNPIIIVTHLKSN